VGEPCAVFLLLQQPEGPPAEVTVSLAEPAGTDQVVVVSAGHTIALDGLHSDNAVLRITGDGEPEGLPPQARGDPLTAEGQGFLRAGQTGDASYGNGARWAQAAAVWWAARQSMSFGGTMRVPPQGRDTTPPPLTLIQGGGKSSRTKRERPALTLVAN
jgi:hypothetical protein